MSQPDYKASWAFVANPFGSCDVGDQTQPSESPDRIPEVVKLRKLLQDNEMGEAEKLVAFFGLCLETHITAKGDLECE